MYITNQIIHTHTLMSNHHPSLIIYTIRNKLKLLESIFTTQQSEQQLIEHGAWSLLSQFHISRDDLEYLSIQLYKDLEELNKIINTNINTISKPTIKYNTNQEWISYSQQENISRLISWIIDNKNYFVNDIQTYPQIELQSSMNTTIPITITNDSNTILSTSISFVSLQTLQIYDHSTSFTTKSTSFISYQLCHILYGLFLYSCQQYNYKLTPMILDEFVTNIVDSYKYLFNPCSICGYYLYIDDDNNYSLPLLQIEKYSLHLNCLKLY